MTNTVRPPEPAGGIRIEKVGFKEDWSLSVEFWQKQSIFHSVLEDGQERLEQQSIEVGFSMKNPQACHQDLRDVVAKLKLHLARICGLMGYHYSKDLASLEKAKVDAWWRRLESLLKITAVTYSGDQDNMRVLISGKAPDQWGMNTQAYNTGLIRLNKTQYPFAAELQDLVEDLADQVKLYLHGHYADQQLVMDFENGPDGKRPDAPGQAVLMLGQGMKPINEEE